MEAGDKVLGYFPSCQEHDSSPSPYPVEDTPLLSSTKRSVNIEEALDSVGVGFFHVILILVTGWALASDSVEVLCIGFVSPQLTSNITNPDLALKPSKVCHLESCVQA